LPVKEEQLARELARLKAELDEHERRASANAQQLERYAADLRETFKRERERRKQLNRSYVATVRALSNAVEARDAYTGKHAERVAEYGLAIAKVVGIELADEPQIEFGFLLHDVGKVAIPDAILFKPAPLSEDEFRLMARHPVVGWEILRDIDFLGQAKDVVRHHHERWDGGGYPDRLAGDDIPLAARVFAIADSLDALTTERPYRKARGLAEGREEIVRNAGSQFDPDVVAAYDEVPDEEFERLRREIG
jgi:HD-GYP domain-containing protein (c-di-GMP phosphodiesterase class II)